MLILLCVIVAFLLLSFPVLRCFVGNLPKVVKYAAADYQKRVKYKQMNLCKMGEVIAYVGLFGKGKTLSIVHRIVNVFKKKDGIQVYCERRAKFVIQRIKVLSNIALKIPYEELISLEQVCRLPEDNESYDDEHDTLTTTLILGDEFSVQLNSREFRKNIDPLFLNTLLTCRHHRISLFYTAQRFGHVDKLLRDVTSYVITCDKQWRFQTYNVYDGLDMESANNPQMLKPVKRGCWFVNDEDYNAYDTHACVGNLKKSAEKGDMLTSEEILNLQHNQPSDMESVGRPSKQWAKRIKQTRR